MLCACQEGCGQGLPFAPFQKPATDEAASDLSSARTGMLDQQEHFGMVGQAQACRHPDDNAGLAPMGNSRTSDDGVMPPPPPRGRAVAVGDGCLETEGSIAGVDPPNKAGRPELLRFEVQLSKDAPEAGGSYGLAHVPMEDGSSTLLVVDFREAGPVGAWNREQQELGMEQCMLQRGDRIVCVNGTATDLNGMRALLRESQVHFTVERWPETVNVLLQKRTPADKYGMQTELFQRDDGTQVLVVCQILQGGLLGEWNRWACLSRRFSEAVVPGCEIIRVGDFSDSPDLMQQALVDRDSADLTFKRPDPASYR